MATVRESVRAWLYSILHEYHDPQRTYSDIAHALSAYPNLRPKTEVFTYDSGASALLLTLSGTIPAAFRGTTYHFPAKLWVPHAYPHEAPMVFVDPAKDMLVRPGQHVGVDGRVYHPYLRDWASIWDRASVAEFLHFLQQVFAKETPVWNRAQQQQYQRHLSSIPQQRMPVANSTPPQLPPKQQTGSPAPSQASAASAPPPVPPKPGEEYAEPSRNPARDGPPLPPLPPELSHNPVRSSSLNSHQGNPQAPRPPSQPLNAPSSGYQNGRPPGPPPLPPVPYQQSPHHPQWRTNHDRSPVSPLSPVNGYSELPEARYTQPAPLAQQHVHQSHLPSTHMPPQQQSFPRGHPQPFQPNLYPPQVPIPTSRSQNKQPLPDLLSDPFDINLPRPSDPTLPAPPIPPNPEREHLLHAISGALVQQAQQKVSQNLSAIAPLQAQQVALRSAYDTLEGEVRQLEQLEQALTSNEAILHRSIQDCDRTIATAKSKKQPPIDEVLLAPTMVANQLWTLCAEEAACREAMYVLQKAVDRGRISGHDFVRQMRALGRESFMKMALARKCAQGMGLEMPR